VRKTRFYLCPFFAGAGDCAGEQELVNQPMRIAHSSLCQKS
jgi:hypothetical protein